MPKKQLAISDLFRGVPLSEPLKAFRGNVEAIVYIAWVSSGDIESHKKELRKVKEVATLYKKEVDRHRKVIGEYLNHFREMRTGLKGLKASTGQEKERVEALKERVNKEIREWEATLAGREKSSAEFESLTKISIARIEKTFVKVENEVIMPMVFVYFVTIWDAFILDTVRRILRVHPRVITGGDAKTELSRAVLWGAKSIEDIRERLIEEVVRDLDYDRKKLVKYFADYWGIDWKESGVPLDEVVEFRARRDILVHNKGMVDRQYLNMVGERSSLEEGEVAPIDIKYFANCIYKLTELAVYIHKIAHRKHYAETEAG
jgi:hypothetical protein